MKLILLYHLHLFSYKKNKRIEPLACLHHSEVDLLMRSHSPPPPPSDKVDHSDLEITNLICLTPPLLYKKITLLQINIDMVTDTDIYMKTELFLRNELIDDFNYRYTYRYLFGSVIITHRQCSMCTVYSKSHALVI